MKSIRLSKLEADGLLELQDTYNKLLRNIVTSRDEDSDLRWMIKGTKEGIFLIAEEQEDITPNTEDK